MTSLFLDALNCRSEGKRPPLWFMRQAGRHLPEYQALRSKNALEDLFTSAEQIVTITKQPVERYELDAAVIFSDILLPTSYIGIDWSYPEGIGPTPTKKISTPEDIHQLRFHEADFSFLFDAIQALTQEIDVPVIGLLGGPLSVASYLIERKHNSHLSQTKAFAYQHPDAFQKLLDLLCEAMIAFGRLQIQAGAQALQFFDSWAGLFSPSDFCQYSLACYQRIRAALPESIPCIYFSRGSGSYASLIQPYHPDAVSVDWSANLAAVRQILSPPVALQGNLDPALLFAPKPLLKERALTLLREMEGDPGFIFNLGHGILPQVCPEQVHFLVDTVREHTNV